MAAPELITPQLPVEAPIHARDPKPLSRQAFRTAVTFCEVLTDCLTCAFGIFLTFFVCTALRPSTPLDHGVRNICAVSIAIGMFVVLLLERDRVYGGGGSLLQIRETERAIRISAQLLLILLPFSYMLKLNLPRIAFVLALIVMPPLLVSQKQLFFLVISRLHLKGYGMERVVVYGAGDTGRRVVSTLLHSPRLGLRPVAVIDDNPALVGRRVFELGYKRARAVPIQRGPITPALLHACTCQILVIAIPSMSSERLAALAQIAKQAGMRVAFLSGSAGQEAQWTESMDIDGLLLTQMAEPVTPWHYAIAKRVMDLLGSAILLVLLAPVFLVIALWIRCDSPGPVLFLQKRVGKDGCLFNMYKFRSMWVDAPKYGVSPINSCDPRITRIGRFLRRTSMDELPQLINVFRGEMSLVGPRPEMPFIVESYTARHRQRLQVVPGITGLWQLSADRAFQIHENLQYDLYYIRNRTFAMDLAILVHTAFFAMRGV
ncbi:MAG TPA: sugar transferase [Acidobacteriaceae bacterium]|jgi:exopolysaccharide biosynthesis polyprenyl glycosylphosphotransferase|nr:sugar transferase [Acidobacteriaceae bacterium]